MGATTTVYVYAGLSVIYEKVTSTPTSETGYYFLGGVRVAKVVYGGAAEYYAYDALGNLRVVVNADGTRKNVYAHRPFGSAEICVAGCGSQTALPYKYTGEYRESAPNLVYLHSRWYDPTIGRFLSPDGPSV